MTAPATSNYRLRAKKFLHEFFGRLSVRRDAAPLDTVAGVGDFVATRVAFVAQKTLFGYLKTRMGTRYPSMFEDDVFAHSIDIAKMNVFAACLSDLSIYAVAHALRDGPADPAVRSRLALRFYSEALMSNMDGAPEEFSAASAIEAFSQRCRAVDWLDGALQREVFIESPHALYRWAPIAPELKKQDTDIVANSISFTWSEIRQIYLRRLDSAAVLADHSAGA